MFWKTKIIFMQFINHKGMSDTFWESTIMYIMVIYTCGMNFITISPPPPFIDGWLQPLLHLSQMVAAFVAIVIGAHTIYEKFFKKKR